MRRVLAVIGMASPFWFLWFWAFLGAEDYWPEAKSYDMAMFLTMSLGWLCTWAVSSGCVKGLRK